MAGYSGTPSLKKLGIKEGQRVLLRNPPARLPKELQDYAAARMKNDINIAVLFAESFEKFRTDFAMLIELLNADGAIWIAWPKKSSGVKTDLSEDTIRDHALKLPLVDVKVCAIDETWSALKFVVRKQQRAAFAAKSE